MEHLLAPQDAKPIDIPYVGVEEYEVLYHDNSLQDFKSYFERKNWQRNSVGDLVVGGRSPTEVLAFFQTWLYFGCLISVFRQIGMTVQTIDFLRISQNGEKLVCTQNLPHLIEEWTLHESVQSPGVTVEAQSYFNPRAMRFMAISEILHFTSHHLEMMNRYLEPRRSLLDTIADPFSRVQMSIMAMGESLSSALSTIYAYARQGLPTWGPSAFLTERLRISGWCPSDSPFFDESSTRSRISVDYYFGGYRNPRERGPHGKCSEFICNAYKTAIDPQTYQQKHTSGCDGCIFVPAPTQTIEIVKKGGVPVITWHGETIRVAPSGPTTKYVALSHVWVDGLGNDDIHNTLPKCQLSRIQGLVDRLYRERHRGWKQDYEPDNHDEHIGFWIDTLCVPVGKGNKDIRKCAISQMSDIYRNADRVLVLDSFILQLPRESDIVDKFVRIHLSSWHHRLWTLQEGQLGKTLFFQFQTGAQTFYDMIHQEELGLNTSALNICSPVRFLCARELAAFYRYFEHYAGTNDIVSRFRYCAGYLRSRQTSRTEDEPVCVATILSLDPYSILSQDTAEGRMTAFYDLVKHFDPRIIFNDHPRLHTDGYRWAPRSLLHQSPDFITVRDISSIAPVAISPGGKGLSVQFPGFRLHNVRSDLGQSLFIIPRANIPGSEQLVQLKEAGPWWKRWYYLRLLSDVEGKYPAWDPTRKYAVILYTDLHPDFLPTAAILGEIKGTTERLRKEVVTVRYICRAHVSQPAQEEITESKAAFEAGRLRAIPVPFAKMVKRLFKRTHAGDFFGKELPVKETGPIMVTVYNRTQQWRVL